MPEEYLRRYYGDIIVVDVLEGMEARGNAQVVGAQVPPSVRSDMQLHVLQLQGRGTYSMVFLTVF